MPTCHNHTASLSLRDEIVGVGQTVPLLDGAIKTYIYFDNAASTPAFRHVHEKVTEFLTWYSSVHRGAGFKSLISTHVFEEARHTVASFVGADPVGACVIFVKNATEAINKLANRFDWRPGDVVISTSMEHHSNDLPWRPKAHIEYVGLLPDGSLDIADLARRLEQHRGKVRLVTATGASNVSGYLTPIHDMAELVHSHGALFMVDCAQLAPHRAIRMGPPGEPRSLDFVVLSGHKMYAPFGSGALIGPDAFFRAGSPDYRGGGTIEIVTPEEVYWAEPPDREEAGTPNVIGAVALAASIRTLSKVGMDAVAEHEAALTGYALRRLPEVPGLRVYGSADPDALDRRLGVITFLMESAPHGKVAAILGFEGGIGVRDGCFCAHPYVLKLLGIDRQQFEGYKARVLEHDRTDIPGLVRVSFGCYNTCEEVDELIEQLQRIAAGDYHGDYIPDRATGSYYPRSFDPTALSHYFEL
jgi:selenocysteine lyase/cysteine desulfurase